jgi:hypothetical protein
MKFRALIVIAAIAINVAVQAQSSPREALAVRQWRYGHEAEIRQQFTTLLSIPNVASDHDNILRNADLSRTAYRRCREKGRTSARHCYGSPFSAGRFDEQKSREMGVIRKFSAN